MLQYVSPAEYAAVLIERHNTVGQAIVECMKKVEQAEKHGHATDLFYHQTLSYLRQRRADL